VTGTCTTIRGALSNESSGFTPDGRYTFVVRRPDHTPYTGNSIVNTGKAASDGSISWLWYCAGVPAGTYTVQVTDETSQRSTDWIPFTIDPA
jgi:hypothetical protein